MPAIDKNPPAKKTPQIEQAAEINVRTAPTGSWLEPVLIGLFTLVAFLPVLLNGFVDVGDNVMLVHNEKYRGLSRTQILWMFTTSPMGHYQPLTWMTFGLDYLLWEMDPFGYHLTNLLLHVTNAVLFYFLSLRLLALSIAAANEAFRLRIAAAFAAFFFSLHPLRVESVAWATARQDVLSALFFLATILAYLRAIQETNFSRRLGMFAAVVFYSLSLLSKASAVTLPVVLLVLDVYPLRRLNSSPRTWLAPAARGVWREKIPFLLVTLVFGVLVSLSHIEVGALPSPERDAWALRVAKPFYGTAFYLWKTLAPSALSPLYEPPKNFNVWSWPFLLSDLLVLTISTTLLIFRRRLPSGLAVWVCYFTILAPVLSAADGPPRLAADRNTYVSCLPFALLVGAALFYCWRWATIRITRKSFIAVVAIAGLVLVILAALSWSQTQVWYNGERLWRDALVVNPRSRWAHHYLGGILVYDQSKPEEGMEVYRRAIEINPDSALAYGDFAGALEASARFEEAIRYYRLAVKIDDRFADAHYGLGRVLARGEKLAELEEAAEQYRAAISIEPNYAETYHTLGNVLVRLGKIDEAIEIFQQILRLQPTSEMVHNELGSLLAAQGKIEDATYHFREALSSRPDFMLAHHNLGQALAKKGDLENAIKEFRQAIKLSPGESEIHFNLGNALVLQGRLAESVEEFQQAIKINSDFAEAHHNLGRVVAEQGNLDRAIASFRQAVRVKPDFAEAHESLARALAIKGERNEAITHYNRALALIKARREGRATPQR